HLAPITQLFPYTTLFRSRRSHVNMLRSNSHRNMYLQEDWNKFGENMFKFRIIHRFDCLESSIKCEQGYIETNLGVGYNIGGATEDRKSTRLNSSHVSISY